MRNLTKYTTLALSALLLASVSYAQPAVVASEVSVPAIQNSIVKGVVYDANTKEVIPDVAISSIFAYTTVLTDEKGAFEIALRSNNAALTATKDGYYVSTVDLFGRSNVNIYLQRMDMTMAANSYSTMSGVMPMANKIGTASAMNSKEIPDGASVFSNSLLGISPAVRVINKSGLPGEGSFVNMRGVRSFFSQNTPLLVIDGAPVKGDQRLSNVINGFSVDIFDPVNVRDIDQVTFLHGADALPFGSLGSNGVIMVQTDKGYIGETKVEIRTTQGVSMLTRQLPMLDPLEFKSYISSIANVRYGASGQVNLPLLFPFLSDDLTPYGKLMYDNNNNWQDAIYSTAFNSDNNFKVKGGDAIVKYMLTAGYQLTNSVVKPAGVSKFYTRANTDISFSDKLNATASFAFNHSDMRLVEQGMVPQTNPLLAAYGYSPFSPAYKFDKNLKEQDVYNTYDTIMMVSNPEAMKTEIEARAKKIDMIINANVEYKILHNLIADLKLGLFYDFNKQDLFSGGLTSKAIAPMTVNGIEALNTLRVGSTDTKNYYGRASLNWNNTFAEEHNLAVSGAFQLMADRESSTSGYGFNTANDQIRKLNDVNKDTRRSTGYSDVLNWMNGFVSASYNYRHELFATVTGTVDASSTYGQNSARAFVFPAVQLGWKMDNSPFLVNSSVVSDLMLRAEYSVNPNSRYSSRYGRYYYVLNLLLDITGLTRGGIPNMYIEPEKVHNFNVGVDFSTFGDAFTVSFDAYEEYTRDMLLESKISPEYGFNTMFKNDGQLRTRGVELSASALLFGQGNFDWRVGGNIGHYNTVIRSLGATNEQIIDLDNGVTLLNRVGETPYQFYGYVSEGVFKDQAEADRFGYRTTVGYKYQEGDIRFKDIDGDRVISDYDRQVIGNATPDVYGNFYSKMTFKNITFYMNWAFTVGNDIYNAVRRYNESGTAVQNQAASMARRWQTPGQVTDIPRVTYIDGGQNNRFSSRWIEDGSYLKLKEVTVSYDINKKVLFFTGLKVYASAENLFTFTKYTGSDPEFSYSYDMELQGMDLGKIPVPKFVKLGLVMNF